MSAYLDEFAKLAAIYFLVLLVPGPDFAVTVRQSVHFGHRVGMSTALGVAAGISIHILYCLLGIGALIQATPWIMQAMKLAGAAYLGYVGWSFLCGSSSSFEAGSPERIVAKQCKWSAFQTGFLTNVTNPKATLFFLAIFTAVIGVATPLTIQIIYGIWMCGMTAIWFMLVSLLFSNSAVREKFMRLGNWFERAMGVIFLAFAIKLILLAI
jgi:RhtB (resistance to homoserine/threonine) family protein